ncbi:MAG: phasin family protein [Bacteroidota bacterium]
MEDLFKKVFYTGVGIVSNTTDTLKKGMEDLVNKGKISEEEGQKVVSSIEENLSEKKEEFEAMLNNAVGLTMAKLNLPTADAINRLEKRIKSLEIKVGLLSKELDAVGKTAEPAKKTTRRRKTAATK